MKLEQIHPWVTDIENARAIQQRLTKRLSLRPLSGPVRTVAGTDVAYGAEGILYAAVVVMEIGSLDLLEEAKAMGTCNFPYRPGFLAFREGPVILKAFRRLRIRPDVVLFDGHGVWHPCGLGLASHLGLLLETPSVGCAKSPFPRHGERVPEEAGRFTLVRDEAGREAAILRTRSGVKPIYISVGHLICLEDALKVVIGSLRGFRIPEPLRRAHLLSCRMKRARERHVGPQT